MADYAKLILNQMPINSTVFTHGDLSATTVTYYHLCENYRPDLKIIDMEVCEYNISYIFVSVFLILYHS